MIKKVQVVPGTVKPLAIESGRLAVSLPGWRWMPGMAILTVGGVIDRIAAIDETYIHAWAESQQQENPRGLWLRYRRDRMDKHGVPFADDPTGATAGCLLAMLGPLGYVMHILSGLNRMDLWSELMHAMMHDPSALGHACIATAAALGQWPGGGE